MDQSRLARVLAGELETTVLTPEEELVWVERFVAKMAEEGPEEHAFFAERRRRGKGVGLDASGMIVHANATPEV